ncbi:hypothetical protein ACN9MZ_00735 [Pseudoduganella sp. S-14]
MNVQQAIAFVEQHGVVLASAQSLPRDAAAQAAQAASMAPDRARTALSL